MKASAIGRTVHLVSTPHERREEAGEIDNIWVPPKPGGVIVGHVALQSDRYIRASNWLVSFFR